jgi:hypothetical protein
MTFDQKGFVSVAAISESSMQIKGPTSFDPNAILSGQVSAYQRYAGANGSIWAFQTQIERGIPFLGFELKTEKNEWLYFGVAKDLGLVYLGGNGEVKLPNGKNKILP